MKIEGTLVEMGDLNDLGSPGLRIEVGDQIIEVLGLTRDQIKQMPAAMFKTITVTFALSAGE